MSSLEERKSTTTEKKKEPSQLPIPEKQLTPNLSLPDDFLVSCFARVSRLYYPTLSLVSKHFRSLLASPELYKARSLLGHTESCLYVCLKFHPGLYPRWYTLCRKPNKTLTNDDISEKAKSSGYVLAPVQIPRSPPACFSGLVAVGSNIYNIEERSSWISILECTSHTWREAPNLREKLTSLSASVVDQKIYVAGSNRKFGCGLKNSLEVFDTRTQTWDLDPIPCSETKYEFVNHRSACIDGKFYVNAGAETVAYDSKEGRWDLEGGDMNDHMQLDSYCEIDNVLYSVSFGELRWYDNQVKEWRYVMGLLDLPEFHRNVHVRLADHGGNMAFMWGGDLFDSRLSGGYEKKIWCAEIALKRRLSSEILGIIEWCDHVLTVHQPYGLVKVLAVTV
ncbi:hypothetical protein EUTSA_v10027065mg [Eutrema salsugineum]|uniref:F-box domain-containing protein n=1 Tax=Eutrema salsugineum TaxID=72664 RepID=V4LZN9_EUTSA|nr:F-box/kelch-repeat protein At5g51250 [Eutrema salsugineum]ESQ56140.1 hypothetical protein EUTSA_v10027065mg [Eutrema salsugineum]